MGIVMLLQETPDRLIKFFQRVKAHISQGCIDPLNKTNSILYKSFIPCFRAKSLHICWLLA